MKIFINKIIARIKKNIKSQFLENKLVDFWPSTIVYPVPVRPLTNALKLPDSTELAGL
jgi:hypothetical protein